MCARVGNQRSRGVVTAQVRTDAVRSLHHQRRDLHQSTYPVPLGRSGLILLSGTFNHIASQTAPSSNSLDNYYCRRTRHNTDFSPNSFRTTETSSQHVF
jgi:hypothetical protein